MVRRHWNITWRRKASWSRPRKKDTMAKLIIGGEQREASDGGTTEIRNPATGEVVDRVSAGTQNDINNAIDAAESAFRKWSALAPPQRGEILYKAAHLLKERDKDLARLLTQE